MPLVRFSVSNHYASGNPHLYTRDADRDDPKSILDAVSVAGLVGILRQLGDLAECAAEVFHGLQEQVMATSSRSRELMVRVQNIEATMPPLERAVLAQTSHIHYAYTAGSDWHPCVPNSRNHFICYDLPRFVMDSYEECRDTPRLHLLDKFDTGGPGSCLKRYSDPTFFRKVSGNVKQPNAEKVPNPKKVQKSKKKRSSRRHMDAFQSGSMSNLSGSIRLTTPVVNGRNSISLTNSANDMTLKSELGDYSISFDSRTGSSYVEHGFHRSSSVQPEELESEGLSSRLRLLDDVLDAVLPDPEPGVADNTFGQESSPEQNARSSSCITWDEKEEIIMPENQHYIREEATNMHVLDSQFDTEGSGMADLENLSQRHSGYENVDYTKAGSPTIKLDEVETQDRSILDPEDTCQMHGEFEDEDFPISSSSAYQLHQVETQDWSIVDLGNTVQTHGWLDYEDCPRSNISAILVDEDETLKWRIIDIGDEMHAELDNDYHLTSSSDTKQLNEVESEGDNFVDALNRLESGSDSEFECQRKYLLQFSSEVSNDKIQDETEEAIASISDHLGVQLSSSMNNGMVEDETNEVMPHFSDYPTEQVASNGSHGKIADAADEVMTHISDKQMEMFTSNSNNVEVVGVAGEVMEHTSTSDQLSLKYEADTRYDGSMDKPKTSDLTASLSMNNFVPEPRPTTSGNSSFGCSSSAIALDRSEVEHTGTKLLTSGFGNLNPEKPSCVGTTDIPSKHQEPRAELPRARSMTFWTNGGLLGLEPSRPPDFALRNNGNQDSDVVNKCNDVVPPNFTFKLKNDEERGTLGRSVMDALSVERNPGSKFSNIWQKDQDSGVGKLNDLQFTNGFKGMTSSMADGDRLLHNSNVETISPGARHEIVQNSSQHSGLEQGMSVNGFHQKEETNERSRRKVFISSLTSSPPLEHMKISFHPSYSSETSKLKLKFPDRGFNNGRGGDVFPSFQLVPEPATAFHDLGSESDDTFCRSSSYIYDGCISHHSDSDSEQWESDESPESEDPQRYDALCRTSTGACLSNTPLSGEMCTNGSAKDGADLSLSSFSRDLPSFDVLQSVVKFEKKDGSESMNPLDFTFSKCSGLPPPLPPYEWMVSRPNSDMKEDTQLVTSEQCRHAFDMKPLEANLSKQHNPASANGEKTVQEAVEFKSQNKNASNQTLKGKPVEEKEDVLQQIRSKSFSLRPTMTAKPSFMSGAAVNKKVTAILEKANAIRQAVANDDGEDDSTWSDN